MANVSTARKIGMIARMATRVASRRTERSRTFHAVVNACRTTATHFGRVIHQLWLEVTGFVFLALAGIGAIAFAREAAKYQAGKESSARAIIAILFTLLFAWFGVTSFWRVRKRG
jgi:hypothetical protein